MSLVLFDVLVVIQLVNQLVIDSLAALVTHLMVLISFCVLLRVRCIERPVPILCAWALV